MVNITVLKKQEFVNMKPHEFKTIRLMMGFLLGFTMTVAIIQCVPIDEAQPSTVSQ